MTTAHFPETDAGQDRASKIAALYSVAKWFVDNPDVPMPTLVLASYHLTDKDEADEYTRMMGALSLIQHIGITPIEGDHTVQGDLDLCTPATHGFSVVYRVIGMKDPQQARRYVP